MYRSTLDEDTEGKFEEEVERWIEMGWLKPQDGDAPGGGVIPLMAVMQVNKKKVRPASGL